MGMLIYKNIEILSSKYNKLVKFVYLPINPSLPCIFTSLSRSVTISTAAMAVGAQDTGPGPVTTQPRRKPWVLAAGCGSGEGYDVAAQFHNSSAKDGATRCTHK